MRRIHILRVLGVFFAMLCCGFGCASGLDGGSWSGGPGGSWSGSPGAGGLGATVGGAQDMGFARSQIEGGQVPYPDAIVVEGLLSEHDIPSVGGECNSLLCLRPSLGVAPSLSQKQDVHWLVLGMSSGLKADTFRRPPMDAVVLIDRSGSMSGDMKETNEAVVNLLKHLRQDDKVAVLKYNERVETVHPMGTIQDLTQLSKSVMAIDAHGNHDIENGLQTAFAVAASVDKDPKRLRRIFVFSCGYPVDTNQFREMIAKYAEQGIGVTFVGVLLGFDHNMANSLSQEKGGSYHFTVGLDQIKSFFSNDFDYMVTPLAYDLKMELKVAEGFEVDKVYGIPGDKDGNPKTQLDVKTVFLSRRKGAILVRLRRKEKVTTLGKDVGVVSLQYTPETAMGWSEPHSETVPVQSTDVSATPGQPYFANSGVRKAVALANMAEQMKAALMDWYSDKKDDARKSIQTLLDYLKTEADALQDSGLEKEVELLKKLQANMK